MSGLKINFNKRELIMVSEDADKSLMFSEVLNCSTGSWPIKYLGVPVTGAKLHILDWLPLDEKTPEKVGWVEGKCALHRRSTNATDGLPQQLAHLLHVNVSPPKYRDQKNGQDEEKIYVAEGR